LKELLMKLEKLKPMIDVEPEIEKVRRNIRNS
jgi:hypothetical protein